MRSKDEELREIMRRAEIIREKDARRKRVILDAVSIAVCLLLLIVVAMLLPGITAPGEAYADASYGSLLIASPYIGYVIVALLAFALGVSAALLCVHWKKLRDMDKK